MNARIAILVAIGVWIAVQAIVPASYYVLREDKHDERFAWRMFSPMRMLRCHPADADTDRERLNPPRFLIDGEPASLGGTFHEGWVEIAKRGRIVVLEAMGQKLCELHPGKTVVLDMACTTIDGEVETFSTWDLCKVPEL
jgi:hypothetical protein